MENYGLKGVFFEIALIELCNIFLLQNVHDPCSLVNLFLKEKIFSLIGF